MTGMMKNKPGPLTPLEPARPVHRQSVGQGDAGVADIDATFELKSVNAKGLDIRLRMPACPPLQGRLPGARSLSE